MQAEPHPTSARAAHKHTGTQTRSHCNTSSSANGLLTVLAAKSKAVLGAEIACVDEPRARVDAADMGATGMTRPCPSSSQYLPVLYFNSRCKRSSIPCWYMVLLEPTVIKCWMHSIANGGIDSTLPAFLGFYNVMDVDEACLWSIGWAMLSSGRGGAMLGTLARGAVSIIRSAMCVLFTTRKGQKTVTSLAYMALLACICQRPPYVMHLKAHTFTMRLSGGTRHL